MLWFSEHLHLGDEGRAGAGANVSRRSVHAKPRIRGSFAALAMERHGEEGRAGAQGRARMSVGDHVHAKPRIRGCFVALERHGNEARPCVARNTNFSNL